jgi:hypothetical protein
VKSYNGVRTMKFLFPCIGPHGSQIVAGVLLPEKRKQCSLEYSKCTDFTVTLDHKN